MSRNSPQHVATLGHLICLGCVLYLLSLLNNIFIYPAALCFVGVVVYSWPILTSATKKQATVLLSTGVLMLLVGVSKGIALPWALIFTRNLPIITMLSAVSFLSLASPDGEETQKERGAKGIISTMLVCHLLGAFINLAIVFVTGDRLAKKGRLTDAQTFVIMRSFGAAAFWSPFFVASGVALTYAPGSSWQQMAIPGLFMVIVVFLLTFIQAMRTEGKSFEGFPLRLENLFLPIFLGAAVFLGHYVAPEIKTLNLIALLAPTAAFLFMKKRPRQEHLLKYVNTQMYRSTNQIVPFFSAGVFAAGIASLIAGFPELFAIRITEFTPLIFAIFSGVMLFVSMIGIHPVISIATVSPFLTGLGDPNQLAFCFLLVWGAGTSTSPLSGIGLAVTGRYFASARQILRSNAWYVVVVWLLASLLNALWFPA